MEEIKQAIVVRDPDYVSLVEIDYDAQSSNGDSVFDRDQSSEKHSSNESDDNAYVSKSQLELIE